MKNSKAFMLAAIFSILVASTWIACAQTAVTKTSTLSKAGKLPAKGKSYPKPSSGGGEVPLNQIQIQQGAVSAGHRFGQ
jgi:hypothetical protein